MDIASRLGASITVSSVAKSLDKEDEKSWKKGCERGIIEAFINI
jgi:hypothetical protein